jgi:hypothetical protein
MPDIGPSQDNPVESLFSKFFQFGRRTKGMASHVAYLTEGMLPSYARARGYMRGDPAEFIGPLQEGYIGRGNKILPPALGSPEKLRRLTETQLMKRLDPYSFYARIRGRGVVERGQGTVKDILNAVMYDRSWLGATAGAEQGGGWGMYSASWEALVESSCSSQKRRLCL